MPVLRDRLVPILSTFALLSMFCVGAWAQDTAAALRLTMPPTIYAVVGRPTSIDFDNIVLTESPEKYGFEVLPKLGAVDATHWTFVPDKTQLGQQTLRVSVKDSSGRPLAQAATRLQIAPSDAGAGRKLTLLIVGDSLTHATIYPNELARLLSTPGNPTWKMLGTHHPESAAPGVAHEGYGGWTWDRFVRGWNPQPGDSYKTRSSPFVFAGANGKPVLDVGRYFDTHCQGQRPDIVTFLLGVNDCFGAKPDDSQAMDRTIDAMLANADILLAAFHQAAPQADLGVCLTTPPNSREAAFQANYKDRYHRWGWKRIQHRLVEREIAHFGGRQSERIFLIPTELNVDPKGGYPENNAVHPNAAGYHQIADSIFAWIKWRLAAGPH